MILPHCTTTSDICGPESQAGMLQPKIGQVCLSIRVVRNVGESGRIEPVLQIDNPPALLLFVPIKFTIVGGIEQWILDQ